MDFNLRLEQLSTEEKIRIMETIWDDLCKKKDKNSSPSWHKNILDDREEQVKDGSAEFMDWDKAKKHRRNPAL